MNTTMSEKAEKIKSSIKTTAEKSKETVREIINANVKHIDSALDQNKKIVDSIKEKFNQQEIEDTVTETVKSTFSKSVELAEDTLDSIINSYTRQMDLIVDFNTKIVDAMKEPVTGQNNEKVLKLIQDNFEASHKLAQENTREILDFYNKHTNLAVNFNRKFGESINAQIETLFDLQHKGLDKFTAWASEWWKQGEKK